MIHSSVPMNFANAACTNHGQLIMSRGSGELEGVESYVHLQPRRLGACGTLSLLLTTC